MNLTTLLATLRNICELISCGRVADGRAVLEHLIATLEAQKGS